jgi:hypothetical protein
MTITKRKQKVDNLDLGPVQLYREDLEAIAAVISEIGPLKIEFDYDYEATEPDDLKDLPEVPEKVKIFAADKDGDPYDTKRRSITVQIDKTTAQINLVEPDSAATGIATRIQGICNNRVKPFRLLCHRVGLPMDVGGFVLIWIYATIYSVVTHGHAKPPWTDVTLNAVLPLVFIALVPLGLAAIWIGRHPVRVINAPRAERPSYWHRTSDMWIIGIITALFGAIIGFILGRIT